MTSLLDAPPDERRGEQRPQLLSRPPFVSSAGPEVIDLASTAGLELDEWQQFSLDVILAEREDDRWAAFETGELVARQNGKGAVIEALGLGSLFLFEWEQLTIYSAHEFKTAQEHFLRILGLIENCDELRRRCKKPRTSHGEESFERLNGDRLRFLARSNRSGRGFTGDRLIMDEAQELPRATIGASLPTLRARPNPQINYFGTVPEEQNNAEQWESLRERARAGDNARLAWLEWCAKTSDLDDVENWRAANPALGIRVREETFYDERASLGDEEFAREILCLWDAGSAKSVLDPDAWHDLTDRRSQVEDPVAFAVDVDPDREWCSIAAGGRREDGLAHVELVDRRKGTAWAVMRLAELVEAWKPLGVILDPAGPAGSLIGPLHDEGVKVQQISGREMAQACGMFYDEFSNRTLRHLGQPEVNRAADAARTRKLGDAWAWHRRDAGSDITPLVACTLALYGAGRPGRRKPKSGRAAFV